MRARARLVELGIELPPYQPFPPAVELRKFLIVGDQVALSGHLPDRVGVPIVRGEVGTDLTVEEARLAARSTAINLLSTLDHAVGSLDRVARVIRVFGMVRAAREFVDHPAVVDGASEVFTQLWGAERGRGVRSAIGVSSLPLGAPVEIELVVQIHETLED